MRGRVESPKTMTALAAERQPRQETRAWRLCPRDGERGGGSVIRAFGDGLLVADCARGHFPPPRPAPLARNPGSPTR
jgi:hypothetical protein